MLHSPMSHVAVWMILVFCMIAAGGCQMSARSRTADAQGLARPKILFIGSSSIYYWKTLNADFADVPADITERGVGGRTLTDVAAHVNDEIIAARPDKVFAYGGSIDLHKGRTPQQVFDVFVGLCDAVHTTLPATKVYFISCKPSIAKWETIDLDQQLNALVRDLAKRETDVVYIDIYTPMLGPDNQPLPAYFAPDMNHLNRAGYELWTKIIRPYLMDGK